MTDTDGDRATWTFAAEIAVRAARCAVREQLRRWELDGAADLAELLVSELVTNVLRHATGPVGVGLTRPAGRTGVLLVEVSGPAPNRPGNASPGPTTRAGADFSSWPAHPAAGDTGPGRTGRRCGANSWSPGEVPHGRSQLRAGPRRAP
ncbi:ATP-binding protein [Streptomyces variabilis]